MRTNMKQFFNEGKNGFLICLCLIYGVMLVSINRPMEEPIYIGFDFYLSSPYEQIQDVDSNHCQILNLSCLNITILNSILSP